MFFRFTSTPHNFFFFLFFSLLILFFILVFLGIFIFPFLFGYDFVVVCLFVILCFCFVLFWFWFFGFLVFSRVFASMLVFVLSSVYLIGDNEITAMVSEIYSLTHSPTGYAMGKPLYLVSTSKMNQIC